MIRTLLLAAALAITAQTATATPCTDAAPVARADGTPALLPGYPIGSDAMLPLLGTGDCAAALPLTAPPQPGDVVLYVPPFAPWVIQQTPQGAPYVALGLFHRVIATEGQTIRFAQGRPVIDGTKAQLSAPGAPQDQAYHGTDRAFACRMPDPARCPAGLARETLPNGPSYLIAPAGPGGGLYFETSPLTVPEGHVYVLSDNRFAPGDPRIPRVGPGLVPVANIHGALTAPVPWLPDPE